MRIKFEDFSPGGGQLGEVLVGEVPVVESASLGTLTCRISWVQFFEPVPQLALFAIFLCH